MISIHCSCEYSAGLNKKALPQQEREIKMIFILGQFSSLALET